VHYRKNIGVSSEVSPISIVTLCMYVDMDNHGFQLLEAVVNHIHSVAVLTGVTSLETPLFFL
jgi:hypothetical protein